MSALAAEDMLASKRSAESLLFDECCILRLEIWHGVSQ